MTMPKPLLLFVLLTLSIYFSYSQSTYTSANYANSGDTFYLTKAQTGNYNFDTTGADITWDYSALAGISQRKLIYRLPSQTGFTPISWPYIYNNSNTNLSSTDGQTIAVFGLQQTNPNDYYLKNTNYLRQKASSYILVINGKGLNIKNVYTSPDTIYKFPLQYNSTNSSNAAYNISIPGVYYRSVLLNRQDTVKGWGTVITPYGSFSNCLKLVSNITETDSVAVADTPVIKNLITNYRELKWFDPSKKYPVLTVKQERTGNLYITTQIEYLDIQQYYQPEALFAYVPLSPNVGDTVFFQNLSTNASNYKWEFGDDSTSTEINPVHIYKTAGIYTVKLIAFNEKLTDTFSIDIKINPVNTVYTFTGNGNWSEPSNWSNNTVPPSPLPATNSIIINHTDGGQCVLNVQQRIASGAGITINTGKNFVIAGDLKLQ